MVIQSNLGVIGSFFHISAYNTIVGATVKWVEQSRTSVKLVENGRTVLVEIGSVRGVSSMNSDSGKKRCYSSSIFAFCWAWNLLTRGLCLCQVTLVGTTIVSLPQFAEDIRFFTVRNFRTRKQKRILMLHDTYFVPISTNLMN